MSTSPGSTLSPTRDVGLGTTYERWAIYALLQRWFFAQPPETAAEGPVDGIAGMAGLHLLPLARRGTRVTVAIRDPSAAARVRRIYERAGLTSCLTLALGNLPPDETFDLVWSFNALPCVPDWRAYLRELASRAGKHLAIVVTNRATYGAALCRALRVFGRAPHTPALFDHEATDPPTLAAAIAPLGRISAQAYVDCPWWPDLFVSAGQTLVGASLARLRGQAAAAPKTRWVHDAESFAFASETDVARVHRRMRLHGLFEAGPGRAHNVLAHHRAYLVLRPR